MERSPRTSACSSPPTPGTSSRQASKDNEGVGCRVMGDGSQGGRVIADEPRARGGAPTTRALTPSPITHHLSPASAGLLMAAPALLLVALFTLYPVGRALYQSTRIESPIFPSRFVGLQNYRDVLGSIYFKDAAATTLWFAAVTVPLLVVLGILTALLLNESFVGNAVLRVGMLLPWALPATVAGLVWKWVFLDSWGALNAGLYTAGLIDNYIAWLTTPDLARMAVVVVFIWTQLPLTAIFLLAALQAIPGELYDAAAVDGAGVFRRFWSITLPGIRLMLVI